MNAPKRPDVRVQLHWETDELQRRGSRGQTAATEQQATIDREGHEPPEVVGGASGQMNFTDIELLRHQIVAMAIQMRTMKSEVSEIVGRLTDYTSRLECNIRRLAERVEQLEQLNTEGNSSPSEDTALDRSLQTNSRKDRKTSKVLP